MKKHEHEIQKEFKEHFDEAVDTFKEMKDPGKFSLGNEFKNAIEVIKLNKKKMHDISVRKTTATAAILFIVLGAVAINVGVYLQFLRFDFVRPSILSLVISALVYVVFTLLMIFIYDFVGSHFFKGKGDFGELYRVLGYGSLVMVAGIIPMLGGIAGLWYIVISYMALSVVKKLNPTNTILTIVITVIIGAILSYLLSYIGYGPLNLVGFDTSLY